MALLGKAFAFGMAPSAGPVERLPSRPDRVTRQLPDRGSSALAAAATALAAGIVANRRAVQKGAARGVARHAEVQEYMDFDPEDWVKRVKMIEGERAVFDVTIPKPLGLVPANFPNRPGVGVAKITPDGNTDQLNRRVIVDGEEGMWVLEGDEVVAVNGETVEGKSLDEVGPLVKNSEGDSVTLTLCRHYMAGPVKVVFLPSGKVATMKRGIEILKAAEVGVEDVSFSCKEGWCHACWHTDPMFGTVYRACSAISRKRPPPKNPRRIPEKWNNVVPLWLLNWRESQRWAKFKKQKREKEKQERLAKRAAEREAATA
mmetsp:Transcript_13256/g.31411  ORF Transcript_13256/g.31411 Transcript_13256/m.31411 type:complete len:316 (+) Transcript_13256:96-1043(+)|eukprot:CAMPEP_0181473216 /NCGR_PEP_ID=MMETSP1110-20121109/40008_1 /TAXON_ID=174948 /ORGANISM="Symbiodinium sp., Strain CCMP421" /LENGTH=315 /DNA_ID=CAMNT_0023598323 /DNA_START=83 /DNA_END=1030 /DNA_ORIENTATION=+